MLKFNLPNNRVARQSFGKWRRAAFAVAATVSVSQSAFAHELQPPAVPSTIQVQAGNKVFLIAHGVGTQNYICLPSGAGFAFALFTPEATLFNRADKQIITHFFSPNPIENGTVRATWQAKDTSTVWASGFPPSFDPAFVAPGAVAWLLLQVTGAQEGPTGGDTLTETTFIQRVNTSGGLAPPTGCASAADIGRKEFVHYEADYVFFTKADDDHH